MPADSPVGQRSVLDVAVSELGVGDTRHGGVGPGQLEHLLDRVQTDNAAAGGDAAGRDQNVCPGTGAQVQDSLAGMKVGDRGGNPQPSYAPTASRWDRPARQRPRRRCPG